MCHSSALSHSPFPLETMIYHDDLFFSNLLSVKVMLLFSSQEPIVEGWRGISIDVIERDGILESKCGEKELVQE